MSIKVSGGGSSGYPGVTTDGHSGLRVAKGLRVGDTAATDAADFLWMRGSTELDDVDANYIDQDDVVAINQIRPVPASGTSVCALRVTRNGSIALGDYGPPAVYFNDPTASLRPVFRVEKQGTIILELSAQQSITGALASVTDDSAKAVLTSIIAALTGIKVAADNTT